MKDPITKYILTSICPVAEPIDVIFRVYDPEDKTKVLSEKRIRADYMGIKQNTQLAADTRVVAMIWQNGCLVPAEDMESYYGMEPAKLFKAIEAEPEAAEPGPTEEA